MWASTIGVRPISRPAAGAIHVPFLFTSEIIRDNLELSDPAAAQAPWLVICYVQTPVEIAQRVATPARHSCSAVWVSSTKLFSLGGQRMLFIGVAWAAWMPFFDYLISVGLDLLSPAR